ncbi:MAG: hypothetical protein EXR36_01070 [Betaproteobacteria bacterium]|nr:hypothetical protein [Betaproteobacteria bacterium]
MRKGTVHALDGRGVNFAAINYWIARMPYSSGFSRLPMVIGLFAMLAGAPLAHAEEATVVWERERCEYVLIKKADGYGLIMQFSAERLKPDDVIESEFQFSVNSGKQFTNKRTGETGMLRGVNFGLTRSQALKSFPKSCKAPAE